MGDGGAAVVFQGNEKKIYACSVCVSCNNRVDTEFLCVRACALACSNVHERTKGTHCISVPEQNRAIGP